MLISNRRIILRKPHPGIPTRSYDYVRNCTAALKINPDYGVGRTATHPIRHTRTRDKGPLLTALQHPACRFHGGCVILGHMQIRRCVISSIQVGSYSFCDRRLSRVIDSARC